MIGNDMFLNPFLNLYISTDQVNLIGQEDNLPKKKLLDWETQSFLITLCMNLFAFSFVITMFRVLRTKRKDKLIGHLERKSFKKIQRKKQIK